MREVVWLVRTLGGGVLRRRRSQPAAVPRAKSREMAEVMRTLPDRYAYRLPDRTLQHVTQAAAAGEWERAVDTTIFVLTVRAVPVTASERDQLAELAETLRVSSVHAEDLRICDDARQGRH
ncbi:MAG: hypothetical protein ACJ72W_03040 [Actinoallomurus sp.]